MSRVSRRVVIGGAVAGTGALGVAAFASLPGSTRLGLRTSLGLAPEPFVPDAPEGRVRLESLTSAAMGPLAMFSAVPAGYGDGAGLPVVVVLHGASASAADLRGFGLGRFVTAAVRAGTRRSCWVGTDDGPEGWVATGGVDPSAMLREELPGWLEDRGWRGGGRGLWGWSRGGYGALRLLERDPTWAAATALFSPALSPGDTVLDATGTLQALEERPWALWCGEDDPFRDGADALVDAAPRAPSPDVAGEGGHTRAYWNSHTLTMLDWLARRLPPAPQARTGR